MDIAVHVLSYFLRQQILRWTLCLAFRIVWRRKANMAHRLREFLGSYASKTDGVFNLGAGDAASSSIMPNRCRMNLN